MTKNTLVLFLLFLFPYLFQSANSKNTSPYFFTQIGVEDGLTQGTVTKSHRERKDFCGLEPREDYPDMMDTSSRCSKIIRLTPAH